MRPIDREPAPLSSVVAVVAAGGATLASGRYSWYGLAIGLLGAAVLAVGVARGVRSAVTLGSAGLVGGALVAGVQGAPAGATLVAVAAGVLAWDAATTAIGVGRQLGRAASTRRLELVHLAGSAAVGAVTIVIGSLLYEAAGGGQPLLALLLLILASVALLTALVRD
ncbi:hypothetical protein ACFO5R_03860 [Halosolutus amylolyticus]|uniref:Glycosyl transferase n=1 Tax=Halosolutus amylolyticus TaxID=2932267 RepID=A0ABD5PMD7_9EURY|nr:hypothetical protein [Halosolutus amylolyticus]